MIEIKKYKFHVLENEEIYNIEEELISKIHKFSEIQRKQFNYELKNKIFKKYNVKEELLDEFNHKCAFCETLVGKDSAIEHFWPKSKYWEKVYKWDNLFISCYACNRLKGNRFPLDTENNPLIINPCNDKIEIYCNENGEFEGLSEKGFMTIDIFALNRKELIKRRIEAISEIDFILDQLKKFNNWENILSDYFINNIYSKNAKDLLDRLTYLLKEDKAFLLAKKNHIERQIKKTNKIIYSEERNHQIRVYDWIKSIKIRNYKSINNLTITLENNEISKFNSSCLCIIGENGVGKSSILEAIALTLSSTNDRTKYIKKSLSILSDGEKKGEISISFVNSEKEIVLYFENEKDEIKISSNSQENLNIPLLAYGAYRLPPRVNTNIREPKYTSIDNLFDPWYNLSICEEFLTNKNLINDEYFNKVSKILKDLLDLPSDSYFERDNNELYLNDGLNRLTFNKLSDGYRAFLTIIIDIIYNWNLKNEDFEDFQGIVLIDEIELHLHPKWKIRIIESFRKVFPNISFIVSTHDPLCLRGFNKDEILFLTKTSNNLTEYKLLSIPDGLTVEEILTGKWFGLESSYDKNTQNLYEEYQNLLINNPDSIEIKIIEKKLQESIGILGNSKEKIAHKVFAQIMQEQYIKNENKYKDIKKEDIRKLILQRTKDELASL